jgi:hypothetical protein
MTYATPRVRVIFFHKYLGVASLLKKINDLSNSFNLLNKFFFLFESDERKAMIENLCIF